ncbi:NUDIX hydrolase [Candidatus Lucifugimonas marina]|uniref:NUDIX domain-containing protein n=1 Tax=Candidatus Lucifugimonas marina TaxID=3038979 RepID=A0AAJ6CRF5_9CHLR|nr:NUDIX domain-containing protein [SAR202 cluster bacterium JH702]MDG0868571.1 NUDIX domain-containing protein [SAR202 cluster bacterium JH639]WFG35206.1 NUDIX domain-containing protein [SAR202 cluster bacterium JH545]WFG39156.1 NUDIX domain-containing protein [SAR202 cluster bacterium JH1073]
MRPKRPTTVAVNRKYEGNRISLRVDTARFEDGPEFDREIVEHPGSVVLIPITKDGKVLLIRQYRQAAERFLLEASAGTREAGEDPEVTAHRELQEEVGYRAGKLIPIGGSWVAPGYSSEYSHIYIATELEPASLPSDDGEDIVVEEIDFEDLHRLISTGELEDQMSIAALLSAQHVYTEHIRG